MDINQSLQPIVASLVEGLKVSLEQELREQVNREVVEKIANTELGEIVQSVVTTQLESRLAKFNFEATTKEQLELILARLSKQINETVVTEANKQLLDSVNRRVAAIDLPTMINSMVINKLDHMITADAFPPSSIKHTSINFSGLTLTGDQIKGGIIENFGSTGIDDRTTNVQLTLMDHASAFEGPLWAPEIRAKGDLYVEGDLTADGDIVGNGADRLVEKTSVKVRESLNTELFDSYSSLIFRKITTDGIDLNRLTQNGREVINNNQLGYHITDSNLQRVGLVRDLQTAGETLLCDTVYVSGKRVGINTIDPGSTLTIWDEEVEIVANKRQQDTGYIGTSRRQNLILGSNNRDNIVLDPEGRVHIKQLMINKVPMSSAPVVPGYESTAGDIVWNEQPAPGQPIGWVCLGATRWAGFGRIE
jgi:hypothetical protein